MCGNLAPQQVREDKGILAADNRVDLYNLKDRQDCRIKQLSKAKNLYRQVTYYEKEEDFIPTLCWIPGSFIDLNIFHFGKK